MKTETIITPTRHSNVVGGSSASRVLGCPASVELTKRMPPRPTSDAAEEGTALHQAIEHVLTHGTVGDEAIRELLLGEVFNGYTMDDALIDEGIIPAADAFDELYSRLEKEDGEVLEYYLELECQFPGIKDAFGTADVVLVTPKRTVIFDWKFGAGVPVSAYENKQLKFYAAAAIHSATLNDATFMAVPADVTLTPDWPIMLVICQPRGRGADGEPNEWMTTYGDLLDFQDKLVAAVAAATKPRPPYARGEHCRWCAATSVCPAYKDVGDRLYALKARVDGGDVHLDPAVRDDMIQITPDLLYDLHVKADIADTWVKSVRKLIEQQSMSGVIMTGYKLIDRLGNTAYVEKDTAIVDDMLARRGLKAAERRTGWKPITPTQAGKVLKVKGLKPLDAGRDVIRPVTGVSLVPLDHPAPAVLSTPERQRATGVALNALTDAKKDA